MTRKPITDWTYKGRKAPKAAGERVQLNLWLFQGKPLKSTDKQEVVIRSFRFIPPAPAKKP